MFFDTVTRAAMRESERERQAVLARRRELPLPFCTAECIEEVLNNYLNKHPRATHKGPVEKFLQEHKSDTSDAAMSLSGALAAYPKMTLEKLTQMVLNIPGGIKPDHAFHKTVEIELPTLLQICVPAQNRAEVRLQLNELSKACQIAIENYVLAHPQGFSLAFAMGAAYRAVERESKPSAQP